MVAGELVAEGTPSGVKAAQGGRVLEIRTEAPQRAAALLKKAMDAWRVSLFGDRLHVIVDGDARAVGRDVAARLGHDGIRVLDHRPDHSLEDVFGHRGGAVCRPPAAAGPADRPAGVACARPRPARKEPPDPARPFGAGAACRWRSSP
jgi:hypothetical protein